ncbi:MAG TPA: LytTR family DNA-binding domain-containing protein [Pyrinomonadaceae bacterium]|nr:LytTR family DNA-binding domain-containing protein [Pyrinomonadaceae bacterium]
MHSGGEKFLVRETMDGIERKLNPHDFLRIRRSKIVRIEQIKELSPLFNGEFEVVLKSDVKLSSSRRYRKNLDALLKS